MPKLSKILLPAVAGLLLTLAIGWAASGAASQAVPLSVNTGQHFLPPYGNARDRFGFDSSSLSGYDVAQLHAGWYSNWGTSASPAHPDQLTYVQVIYFYAGSDPGDPTQVSSRPDRATIASIAAAQPGSLWLLGNEPDSLYLGNPLLPEVYALVYHDFHKYIKGVDPSAIIANGGIVQPTPCRLEYLDIVFDTYMATYSETMPVDVWNTHAFVLREVYASWGASTPPGVDPSCAMDYTVDEAADIGILEENLKALRAWMKARGYQDKPLIISEYGILWPQWFAPQFTPEAVGHYMTQTFDLFLNKPDLELGYPADDYRLVQAWAWYSLSDDEMYNGFLFNSSSKTISPMGEAYAAYTAALSDTLYVDLSARLSTGAPVVMEGTGVGVSESLSFSLPLTAHVGNLGKLEAPDVLVRFEIASARDGSLSLQKDQSVAVPSRFNGIVSLSSLTATLSTSGLQELQLWVDPLDAIDEPREGNNVVTATLDLRPDWVLSDLDYRIVAHGAQSGTLELTATVRNQGYWPAPATQGVVSLVTAPEGSVRVPGILDVPPIAPGQGITLTGSFTLAAGLYELRVGIDPENTTDEPYTDNNALSATLDLRPDLVPVTLDYRLLGTLSQGGTLLLTATVQNQGSWPSPDAGATVYVETLPEVTPVDTQSLALPALSAGAHVTLETSLALPAPGHDLYRLVLELDSEDQLAEQDEDNNRGEVLVPVAMSFTVMPGTTTVFTSASGAIQLYFPPGAVTTPTEFTYQPLWPADWVSGTLQPANIAFSLTAVFGGQPVPLAFAKPVSVTLRYYEGIVTAIEEKYLRIFVQGAGGGWNHAACQPYERDVGENRLGTAVCHTGRFLFWNRYDVYFWVIVHEDPMPDGPVWWESGQENETPRAPLLLPRP